MNMRNMMLKVINIFQFYVVIISLNSFCYGGIGRLNIWSKASAKVFRSLLCISSNSRI